MNKVNEIIHYGKLIDQYNLISSHSGNISVRIGNNILITKSGTMLGQLKKNDLTLISFNNKDDKNLKKASMETIVHRAIYLNSDCSAIIHTHPQFTIILSYFIDSFSPIDSEGKFILKEIPVIKAKNTIASLEVADNIKDLVNNYSCAIVRSHGLFVWSDSLEKAFYLTTAIENSAKIYYFTQLWKRKEN